MFFIIFFVILGNNYNVICLFCYDFLFMVGREIKSNYFFEKNYSNLEVFWWNKNNIFENFGSVCIEK